MSRESILNGLQDLGIEIEVEFEKLDEFYELLVKGNETTDLTNIIERNEVDIKHFLDSLTLFKIPEFSKNKTLIDIGTGAGFPGIPLKLINPDLDVTLLDGLNKRLIFLDNTIAALGLENIRTFHGRGEELGRDNKYRESFDIGVSRAVSRLDKLSEISLPLVKVGGIFVAMKGIELEEELREAKGAIEKLGKIRDVIEFNLTQGENGRTLIVIEKIKATPEKYPRHFGKIKKTPLR